MKKLIISFIAILLTVVSFGQTSTDDNTAIIKANFPKVYSVIVNEAKYALSGDYAKQNEMIDDQCLAFSVYIVLMYSKDTAVPKETLLTIQINSIEKCCKNFTINTECNDLTDTMKKVDCMLSYMIVDWIKVIYEMNDQIKAYNRLNKAT